MAVLSRSNAPWELALLGAGVESGHRLGLKLRKQKIRQGFGSMIDMYIDKF
ncbi:hypothetical protein BDV32DRAFT_68888 [Aspergillus pseudonomiae]|nr:hypothetical protein BDV32DRAFT_68888 [Aspergillus pseudonomiae]